jgi:arylsulfatase A-like enzyme
MPPWRPASYREADVSDKPPHVRRISLAFWYNLETLGIHDAFVQQQLESLLAVDEAVAAILDELEALGLSEDTLVLFTSDNGYMWGEHRLTGKIHAYEESIRVPLVARYPLLGDAPRSDDRLVVNLDLAPTFLELAGAPRRPDLPGRSLVPVLARPEAAAPWRDDFLGEHWKVDHGAFNSIFRDSTNRFLRTRRWKLVVHSDPFFPELYDLASDPLELENFALDPAYTDLAVELYERLLERAGEAP